MKNKYHHDKNKSDLINQQELKKSMKQKSLIRVKELPNYEEVTKQTYDIFTNLYNRVL